MKTRASRQRPIDRAQCPIELVVLFASILVFPGQALGQVQPQPIWSASIGSAAALGAMAFDSSGNIIVAGYDAGDYLTAKYDTNGNLLWSARESGRVGDIAVPPGITSLTVDDAGNVYVT